MADTNPSVLRKVFESLEAYLGVTIIRKNQNGQRPEYPFVAYGVLTRNKDAINLRYAKENADPTKVSSLYVITEGVRISLSFYNSDSSFPLDAIYDLAAKAREWFELIGKFDLEEIGVVCDDFGSIQDRSVYLDSVYEYQAGFDFRIKGTREIEFTVDAFDLDATRDAMTMEVL